MDTRSLPMPPPRTPTLITRWLESPAAMGLVHSASSRVGGSRRAHVGTSDLHGSEQTPKSPSRNGFVDTDKDRLDRRWYVASQLAAFALESLGLNQNFSFPGQTPCDPGVGLLDN